MAISALTARRASVLRNARGSAGAFGVVVSGVQIQDAPSNDGGVPGRALPIHALPAQSASL